MLSPVPSDEAKRAREEAEGALDDATDAVREAAEKTAEALRAIDRLRRLQHADSFVDLVRQALEVR